MEDAYGTRAPVARADETSGGQREPSARPAVTAGGLVDDLDSLLAAAHRACLRVIPWALEDHEVVIQEALTRALARIEGGARVSPGSLPGYVYGVARRCAQEMRRRRTLERARACALPHDDLLMGLVDDAPFAGTSTAGSGELRGRLLDVLRYYVVHAHADATAAKQQRVMRDAYLVARHFLRGTSLPALARELGLSDRAARYAVERTLGELAALFDHDTGELRSFVENSHHFDEVSELTGFLRDDVPR